MTYDDHPSPHIALKTTSHELRDGWRHQNGRIKSSKKGGGSFSIQKSTLHILAFKGFWGFLSMKFEEGKLQHDLPKIRVMISDDLR